MLHQARPSTTSDGLPNYPDILALGVPRGWKAGLRARAEAEGVSVASLVRDAIEKLARPPKKARWRGTRSRRGDA